jgi:hypothetical protein
MFGPVVLTSPGQSSYRNISTSSSSRSSSTSASWTIGGVSMTPHYRVRSSYNTYNNVSSIPSTWRDTTWETQVPSSVSGAEGARAVMAAPAVELVKSRLQVSLSAAAPADQALRVQLFNAQGVMVADLKGTLQKGARTVTLAQPKGTLAAGMYVASVTAGERNFRTPLICEK